jgi:hypothetical protein
MRERALTGLASRSIEREKRDIEFKMQDSGCRDARWGEAECMHSWLRPDPPAYIRSACLFCTLHPVFCICDALHFMMDPNELNRLYTT